ncbi:MAG: hypothetical protein MPN21_07985 [Thermoanaerobaculia bacterium]|nr:hypothetical protein [Thermoanaerobaculia bacterium]
MSQATLRFTFVLAALLLLAMVSSPVVADILIMTDGSRLEIEGEWREKGRVIEFTLPNGTLGSVRASEVDLDASREATRIANEPPADEAEEGEEEEKPAPVAVWTNKDIPQAAPDVIAGATASVDAQAVQVTTWQAEPGDDANVVSIIRGTLQNFGNNRVTGLSLSVTITGSRPTGTDPSLMRQARLDATELSPGETTDFVAEVRRGDVASVGSVEEFGNPQAAFEVLFDSNPQDDESDVELDSDEP